MHTVAAAAGQREEEGGQVWTIPSLLYHCTILHQLRNGHDLVVTATIQEPPQLEGGYYWVHMCMLSWPARASGSSVPV